MATTGIVNGHYLRAFDNGVALAYATECSISINAEMRSLSHKDTDGTGGGWAEKAPGEKSATGSTSGLYAEDNNAAAALFAKLADGTPLTITFTTNETGDTVWSGEAFLVSLEINAANNESVTYSASWEFNGALTMGTVS